MFNLNLNISYVVTGDKYHNSSMLSSSQVLYQRKRNQPKIVIGGKESNLMKNILP